MLRQNPPKFNSSKFRENLQNQHRRHRQYLKTDFISIPERFRETDFRATLQKFPINIALEKRNDLLNYSYSTPIFYQYDLKSQTIFALIMRDGIFLCNMY